MSDTIIPETSDTESTDAFIIENAGNSSYIDSLLVCLFYVQNYTDVMLYKKVESKYLYLQEYILTEFVEKIRNNNSIFKETINKLRYLCFRCGWSNEGEILNICNIIDFYNFIASVLNGIKIKIKKEEFIDGTLHKTTKEEVNIITLNISEKHQNISITELLNIWSYKNLDNTIFVRNIENIPKYLSFFINRSKCSNNIVIHDKIYPFKNSGNIKKKNIAWKFHSVICMNDNTVNKHYYAIINNNNKWILFNNLNVPCMKEIYMNDPYIISKIKTESVFLLYVLT